MSYFSKRALRWAAPVALVGALGLAACGNSDNSEAVRVAAPGAAGVGSDQHLNNQAAEIARASAGAGSDQHLSNQAEELARQRAEQQLLDRQAGSDQHLSIQAAELAQEQRAYQAASARLTAQAEQVERSAHLEGQANTYSREAGNRAAQMAQAEAYVEQQQDRAESSSYDGEFLPGSRHVPTR